MSLFDLNNLVTNINSIMFNFLSKSIPLILKWGISSPMIPLSNMFIAVSFALSADLYHEA